MRVADWHDAARQLRDAGLTDLGDFYAENARRVSRGERPVWPVPPELRASQRLADVPLPPPFVDDGREG